MLPDKTALVIDTVQGGFNIAYYVPGNIISNWRFQCGLRLLNQAELNRTVQNLRDEGYTLFFVEDFYQHVPEWAQQAIESTQEVPAYTLVFRQDHLAAHDVTLQFVDFETTLHVARLINRPWLIIRYSRENVVMGGSLRLAHSTDYKDWGHEKPASTVFSQGGS